MSDPRSDAPDRPQNGASVSPAATLRPVRGDADSSASGADGPSPRAPWVIALALTAVWFVGALAFLAAVGKSDGDGTPATGMSPFVLLALILPVVFIWMAAGAAYAALLLRAERARLKGLFDAIGPKRDSDIMAGSTTAITGKLEELAAVQRKIEATLARSPAPRGATGPEPAAPPTSAPPQDDHSQARLALGTPAEALDAPLSNQDFIRALNFPDTAEDKAGFAALRKALRHRPTAQLVQASQDVLTLLSQDGIFMDDLRPDMVKPEVWRSFADGARGRGVAGLGGVRDRSSLALTAGRMKQDTIFRDAAHHFLRVFDKRFTAFAASANDAEIAAFGNTRTSRAFMLLGRVAGTFQ